MDLELQRRRALVTGGSRGIGLAIARVLVDEGAHVAIAARDVERLESAAAELRTARCDPARSDPARSDPAGVDPRRPSTGVTVATVVIDTGDDASVRTGVDTAAGALGGIDILVNCAAQPGGHAPPSPLADLTDQDFLTEINVKALGYLRCARAVAPWMIRQRWGRIINVSGLAARQTGSLVGSVRNVAVAALTKNLADELGGQGINVTVVHPGMTRTEKTAAVFAGRTAGSGSDPVDEEARVASGVAIGRIVEASEVADVVAFLASPKSVAITGDAIAVGGGSIGAIHY